jgi:hypothetical protein
LAKHTRWWTIGAALILLAFLRDIAVAPAARQFFDEGYKTYLLQSAQSDEVLNAVAFIVLGYAALFGGFWLARFGLHQPKEDVSVDLSGRAVLVGATLIACVGLAGNLVVMRSLMSGNALMDLVSQRAVFYDERAIYTPLFNYARTLSPLAEIGGWSLIVVGALQRRRRVVTAGLATSIGYIVLQVLFGSRMATLVAGVGLAFVWHCSVRRLRARSVVFGVLSLVTMLAAIQAGRGYAESLSTGSASLLREAAVGRAVDEMAFATKAFPSTISYFGWNPVLDGVRQSFPNNRIVGGQNIWAGIVEDFYRGVNPSGGVGGEHYSFGPEHYMCFGPLGLILISGCCGLIFGRTLRWADLNERNPFAVLMSISLVCVLTATLFDGRMLTRVGSLPLLRLLPLGVLATLVMSRRDDQLLKMALVSVTCTAVFLDTAFDSTFTDVASLSLVSLLYCVAFSALLRVSRGNLPRRPTVRTVPDANRLHHTIARTVAIR